MITDPPAGHEARRAWLTAVDARTVRLLNDISLTTIGRALGVPPGTVHHWENGRQIPKGARGAAYCRVIAGLARHLEITR